MRSFLIFILATVTLCQSKESPPQFSKTYSAKGTLNIPYAEIKEPFYAWYDGEGGSSRIDYYGGMAKTFQIRSGHSNGSTKLFKIVPVTNDDVENVDTCFMGGYDTGLPQTVLPDVRGFEFVGEEIVNGLHCNKFMMTNTIGDKVNKYTIWTRSKKSWVASGVNSAVPVRYEMKGYNTLLGSHYDHYYIDYEWFSPDRPSPDVFKVPTEKCKEMLGAGSSVYTFNPMKEFVNNYDDHVHEAFEDFKSTHDKKYVSIKEHTKRFDIFRHNLRFIHSHNRAGKSYQLGVNHLADKDEQEIRALRGNLNSKSFNGKPFPYTEGRIKELIKDLPESLDWRINGAVTPVKDQSVCGSCWSFGTTGTLEGAYFLKNKKLVSISQQALVDCSWGSGNNGCDGGEDIFSFDWMKKHGGIPTEDEYGPYLGQDGYCHVNSSMNLIKIKEYYNVKKNIDALKLAVAIHGPISVAIDAAHKTFSFYSNGVFFEPSCSSTNLDHAVLVVGYGKLDGEDYWLVKNSWSTYWGNDGYVLMAMKDNNCGVLSDANYVEM